MIVITVICCLMLFVVCGPMLGNLCSLYSSVRFIYTFAVFLQCCYSQFGVNKV